MLVASGLKASYKNAVEMSKEETLTAQQVRTNLYEVLGDVNRVFLDIDGKRLSSEMTKAEFDALQSEALAAIERGAGDEAEDEGAGGEVPVVAGGEGEGGGGDVEEDAVTLDGDDLIFLQEGSEFDGKHVAGLVVVDDAPVGVQVVALGAGVGLAFLMAFGGADEVEFSLEAGGEEGGGEVVVAHVGGEDDGAGGDL
jgi:hypothetical protein